MKDISKYITEKKSAEATLADTLAYLGDTERSIFLLHSIARDGDDTETVFQDFKRLCKKEYKVLDHTGELDNLRKIIKFIDKCYFYDHTEFDPEDADDYEAALNKAHQDISDYDIEFEDGEAGFIDIYRFDYVDDCGIDYKEARNLAEQLVGQVLG